ncbi:MAG TPA: 2OG-Fe(II) oxygenase [Permianibacter sp.]|nr:2OG-Fe(II) oxygenase [Permianibacter sp.]
MLRQPDLPAQIAAQLRQQDYLVIPDAIAPDAVAALRQELLQFRELGRLQPAAIGHGNGRQLATQTRSDLTCWLTGETQVQQRWLAAMEDLRQVLNQQLMLGLVEYECHYACYPPGSFYRRHLDAFRGNNARQVSTVLYLNPDWSAADGGQLCLYRDQELLETVVPQPGTLVVFLAEHVPHEVQEAHRERLSIAGWLRRRSDTLV